MNSGSMRTTVGLAALAGILIYDVSRNGKQSSRLREYGFLVLCVIMAVCYGVLNDQITSRISWEYFYYGKELAPILGAQTPPDSWGLSLQAMRIGAEATWWVGLLLGAVMLIANNPSREQPRLGYSRLIGRLPAILGITIGVAIVGGLAGYLGLLNWISADFQEMSQTNYWRPVRFMTVYGVHLGGYVGGAIGGFWAIGAVVAERRRHRAI